MAASKTAKAMWDRLRELNAKRDEVSRRFDLVRDHLGIEVPSGFILAYLLPPKGWMVDLYAITEMKRVSRKARINFDVRVGMLHDQYDKGLQRLREKAIGYAQAQLVASPVEDVCPCVV